MDSLIASTLEDWAFIRGHTKAFVKTLGANGLSGALPRPGLDTPAKHVQEMLDVQRCYRMAIETGTMTFDYVRENDAYDGDETVESLLARIDEEDKQLAKAVENLGPDHTVDWTEEGTKLLISHLGNLLMHESLHLGQLVAFCYVTGLPLPEKVSEEWALSPQKS